MSDALVRSMRGKEGRELMRQAAEEKARNEDLARRIVRGFAKVIDERDKAQAAEEQRRAERWDELLKPAPKKVDVMTMTQPEYHAYLRSKGHEVPTGAGLIGMMEHAVQGA